jgi:protein TonB
MRHAFLVSVGLHLVTALLLILPLIHLGRRVALSPVYHVRVVELPTPPSSLPPAPVDSPVQPPPAVTPRPKPLPKPKPITLPPPRRETVKPAPAPKEAPVPPAAPPQSATATTPVPSFVLPKVDAPEFDCSDYCLAFQRKLESQWTPPPLTGHEPMQAIVVFTINRDGSVSGLSVEATSGNFYFDQAAQRAVLLAAPLPPLPRSFLSPTLRVHVAFTWQPTP